MTTAAIVDAAAAQAAAEASAEANNEAAQAEQAAEAAQIAAETTAAVATGVAAVAANDAAQAQQAALVRTQTIEERIAEWQAAQEARMASFSEGLARVTEQTASLSSTLPAIQSTLEQIRDRSQPSSSEGSAVPTSDPASIPSEPSPAEPGAAAQPRRRQRRWI